MATRTYEEMPRGGDPNFALLGTIGLVGAILVVVFIFVIQAWFYSELAEAERVAATESTNLRLIDHEQEQLQRLGQYRARTEEEGGGYAMPIDRAIDLVVEDYQQADAPR